MTRGAAGVEGIASFGGAHFQIFGAGLEGAAAKQRQQNDVRFAAVGLQHGGAGLPRGSVTSSIELRCRNFAQINDCRRKWFDRGEAAVQFINGRVRFVETSVFAAPRAEHIQRLAGCRIARIDARTQRLRRGVRCADL